MAETFSCPSCGAPLEPDGDQPTVRCIYCNSSVIVPEAMRRDDEPDWAEAGVHIGTQVNLGTVIDVSRLIRAGKTDEAAAAYAKAFDIPLEDAHTAVQRLASGQAVAFTTATQSVYQPPTVTVDTTEINNSARKGVNRVGYFIAGLVVFILAITLIPTLIGVFGAVFAVGATTSMISNGKAVQTQIVGVSDSISETQAANRLTRTEDAALRTVTSAARSAEQTAAVLERTATAEDRIANQTAEAFSRSATEKVRSLALATESADLLSTLKSWPVTFKDSFDSKTFAWPTGSEKNRFYNGERLIQGGKYRWTVEARSGMVAFAFPNNKTYQNSLASVSIRFDGFAKDDDAGIVVRQSDSEGSLYYFAVNPQGQYLLSALDGANWDDLIGWTPAPGFRPDAENVLSIAIQGDRMVLMLNGQFLDAFSDDRLTQGRIGIGVEMHSAGDKGVVEFDNFEVRSK
jgi:DNA-directed RNA polymerase subunit RPC12/RpoP